MLTNHLSTQPRQTMSGVHHAREHEQSMASPAASLEKGSFPLSRQAQHGGRHSSFPARRPSIASCFPYSPRFPTTTVLPIHEQRPTSTHHRSHLATHSHSTLEVLSYHRAINLRRLCRGCSCSPHTAVKDHLKLRESPHLDLRVDVRLLGA